MQPRLKWRDAPPQGRLLCDGHVEEIECSSGVVEKAQSILHDGSHDARRPPSNPPPPLVVVAAGRRWIKMLGRRPHSPGCHPLFVYGQRYRGRSPGTQIQCQGLFAGQRPCCHAGNFDVIG